MSDLISRQLAIDAVNFALFPKINTAKDAEKALRALSSAQPELCEDAVSRQVVYTVIEEVLYETTKGADNWYGLLNDGVRTLPPVTPNSEQRWIPCSEGLPEEDHFLGGSGKQFSEKVLVTVVNHDDDDIWIDATCTVDGKWILKLPRHCRITAWMPLPKPYTERREE